MNRTLTELGPKIVSLIFTLEYINISFCLLPVFLKSITAWYLLPFLIVSERYARRGNVEFSQNSEFLLKMFCVYSADVNWDTVKFTLRTTLGPQVWITLTLRKSRSHIFLYFETSLVLPIVEIKVESNALSEKRNKISVFPTPESPIRSTLKR